MMLGIPFFAEDFGEAAQKDIIVNSEEQFSVISMYGWHGQGLFTMENVMIIYLSTVLDTALEEISFKSTLRLLTFYEFGVKIWDPIPVMPTLD